MQALPHRTRIFRTAPRMQDNQANYCLSQFRLTISKAELLDTCVYRAGDTWLVQTEM